jgi:hypothetical protein
LSFSPFAGADLTREQYEALTRRGDVSNVIYDAFDRCVSLKIDNITYTIVYASTTITISGDDGSVKLIDLDGSGRIAGAASA